MKDILIAITPKSDYDHEVCKELATGRPEYKPTLQILTDTAWLLTGPKSFEVAISICHILTRKNLQYICVEVESLLLVS